MLLHDLIMMSSNVSDVNVTSVTSTSYPTSTIFDRKQFDWIFPISCIVLLLASGIWILASLVHYGIKTKQWKPGVSRRDTDKLNAGKIYSSVIVCAVLCDIYLSITLFYTNVGFELNKDRQCEYLGDTSSVFYALCLLSVQTFLWLRQRAFYTNRMLNVNYSKSVKVVSFLSIVVIFVIGFAIMIIYIYPDNYKSSLNGCTYVSDYGVEYTVTIIIVIVICQTSLLGLFVYALQQTKQHSPLSTRKKSYCCFKSPANEELPGNNNISTISIDATSNIETMTAHVATISRVSPITPTFQHATSNAVRKIIRKTIIFAFISFAADAFILVMTQFITDPDSHRRYPSLAGNMNTFLNLLLIVFSFAHYQKMLTSPCRSYR